MTEWPDGTPVTISANGTPVPVHPKWFWGMYGDRELYERMVRCVPDQDELLRRIADEKSNGE